MLAKGQRIHVIRAVDANWLEVQTEDGKIGFMSAKPKYSDYTSPDLASKQADALIAFGSTFLGTHYEFGADPNQTATFDCSSFVNRVFGEVLGIDLPRVSYDQAKEGREVKLETCGKGICCFLARGGSISVMWASMPGTAKYCIPIRTSGSPFRGLRRTVEGPVRDGPKGVLRRRLLFFCIVFGSLGQDQNRFPNPLCLWQGFFFAFGRAAALDRLCCRNPAVMPVALSLTIPAGSSNNKP